MSSGLSRPSDLLLEGSLCCPGGGIRSGSLDGLVGHDACSKLLLGLLKAGAGGTVHRMDLMTTEQEVKKEKEPSRRHQHVCRGSTFLNMMRDMTASEVNRAAMMIMIMPTGMLVFRPIRAEIHPLPREETGSVILLRKVTHTHSVGRVSSPGSPTGDADALQNVDAKLTDVHEEEEKEPERTVAPAERRRQEQS